MNSFFLQNGSNSKPSFETSHRFYPPDIPVHANEPTRDKFAIVYDERFGEGVVSKTFIQTGEVVFRFDGFIRDYQTLFTLQKKPGVFIEDSFFVGKILHSCDPNTHVDMELQIFYARKDIRPGDFITMDYETTEDELFRQFDCGCGSPECRGQIAGKRVSTLKE